MLTVTPELLQPLILEDVADPGFSGEFLGENSSCCALEAPEVVS